MAQIINPGRKDTQNALDAMVRLLQGYQAFTGARENVAKTDALNAETERQESGALNNKEKVSLAKEGFTFSDTQTPGAFQFTDYESGDKLYATPPKPKEVYQKTDIVSKEGRPLTFNPQTGNYAEDQNVVGAKSLTKNTEITPYQSAQLDMEKQRLDLQREKSQAEKQPNQGQFAAGQFGKRVEQANAVLDNLSAQGYNRADKFEGLKTYLPNVLKSNELQEQEQAERNFVNAVLRRESGAAIAPSEFASAEKQYFPRSGDSPEVLAQKQQNREQALAGLRAEAGPAWDKIPSVALGAPKRTEKPSGAVAGSSQNGGFSPGSIIEVNGQRMRVNADGKTATPLR